MKNILINRKDAICEVVVNRPDQLNALNKETLVELEKAFHEIGSDVSVRAVILTGAGEKSFVAGADLKELSSLSEKEAQELSLFGQGVFQQIEELSQPVIAAVNGFALGGGLELALSASFRVASSNARFALPEVGLGLIPGYGGTQRLAREVGYGRAAQMIATADMISADVALSWGLVSEVVSSDELLPRATQLGESIAKKSPVAVTKALQALRFSIEHPDQDGFSKEAQLFGECFSTGDMKEGVSAFLEKRAATFKGI